MRKYTNPQLHAARCSARQNGLRVEEVLQKRMEGLARCTRCKEWLTPESFGRDASRHDGRARTCRSCNLAKNREWRTKENYTRDHAWARARMLEQGMTPEEFEAAYVKGARWCRACQTLHDRTMFGADREQWDGRARLCREQARARTERYRIRREVGSGSTVTIAPSGPRAGLPTCGICINRPAPFTLKDGTKSCARCLKDVVKERKSETRSVTT